MENITQLSIVTDKLFNDMELIILSHKSIGTDLFKQYLIDEDGKDAFVENTLTTALTGYLERREKYD